MVNFRGVIFHVPLDVATGPADGKAICDRWWAIHPEKGLAFYARLLGNYASEEPSPQCNHSEATARKLQQRLHPDHEIRKIPVVFMAHAIREMRRLRLEARKDDND